MIHKTTRSILSVLLAVLLLVTSTPLTPAFAGGGGVSLQSESGEGGALEQVNGEYQIYTADDLKEFAAIVNGTAEGIVQNTSANAKLMNDIDLNGSEENPWIPIGTRSNPYRGTFNGDGHTISGLYIDSTADYQGLFGYVSGSGKVQNLSVSGSVKGDNYVGGVVGYNISSTVENCYNTVTVTGTNDCVGGVVGYNNGGTVENCYNTGEVSGPDSGNSVIDSYVGGVVGQNFGGTVENCYNTGKVSGPDSSNSSTSDVGGVVGRNGGNAEGWNGGTVENCYNTGSVSGNSVGGVVGYNYNGGSVTNSYNTGEVSGKISVGGVVGYNHSGGSVTNSYNTGEVSGKISVGGVVGYNHSGGSVTGCYFLQQDPAIYGIGNDNTHTGATPVNDLDALCENFESVTGWKTNTTLNRPVLISNHEDDGSEDHPYEIFTPTQLKNFRDLVNRESGNPAAWAVLMENITLNSNEEWEPIGNEEHLYTGTFDGNGKTISGLYIDSSTNDQGLFGCLDQGGTVKDLSVSGNVSGDMYVGGVVGYNNGGTVTGCTFSVSGKVSGSNHVGGVVGSNSGTVENCYNTGSVKGSGIYVGGVVGNNGGSVTNCYNTGEVSGTYVGGVVGWNSSGDSSASVTNCYNTGTVTGNRVGGVVGYNISSVTNCYFLKTADVNVGRPGIGGGSGTSSNVEARTADAFHSGEVAYLLQSKQADGSSQVWGQSNLTTDKSWPTLVALDKDENAKPVYKVAFISDNTEIEAEYANSGMTVTPPKAPEKTGHLFGGWYDNAELTGDPVTGTISVKGNATYTAKWEPYTYSISVDKSTLDFGSMTEGDTLPAAQTVTITNTGNQSVTVNLPTSTNYTITAGTGFTNGTATLAPDKTATFTVQPKDNLPRGSYSEQIVVSNTNGEKAAITATFTVKEPPYTGKYSYEVFTSVGDNGAISVDRYATEGEKVTIDVTPDQAYKLDDLSVTANGKDVELTANSDGTFSFTMPSADVKITATFAEDPDWTPDEPEEPTTDVSDLFIDIAPDAWYKDAIQYAYDHGLMTGVSATEFAPEATTTRAMIVSILARLEGVESAQAAGFADVDDEWYATAVNWAANVGVVNGYEDNTFQPNTAITREQLAAILMNYAAYKGEDVSNRADLGNYTDQPSTWAQEAMQWAVAEGLISGVTNTELQPQGNATRAQVAAILQRFLDK